MFDALGENDFAAQSYKDSSESHMYEEKPGLTEP